MSTYYTSQSAMTLAEAINILTGAGCEVGLAEEDERRTLFFADDPNGNRIYLCSSHQGGFIDAVRYGDSDAEFMAELLCLAGEE